MSNDDIFNRLSGFMSEEQAMGFLQNLDEEQVSQMVTFVVEEFVGPRLQEIRQQSKTYKSRHEVRREYESMSDDEQNKRFHNAVAEMRKCAVQIRQSPADGMRELKTIIRNPWYHEAILLAFHQDPGPDEPTQKEFATYMGRWILMGLVPEMYTEEEARDLVNEVFDMSYEEALSKAQREKIE